MLSTLGWPSFRTSNKFSNQPAIPRPLALYPTSNIHPNDPIPILRKLFQHRRNIIRLKPAREHNPHPSILIQHPLHFLQVNPLA